MQEARAIIAEETSVWDGQGTVEMEEWEAARGTWFVRTVGTNISRLGNSHLPRKLPARRQLSLLHQQ